MPEAPPDIKEEVELYAREYGRTGSIVFYPTIVRGKTPFTGTWVVELSLRCNDKRMLAYQDGRASKPPVERVWLHEPNPRAGQIGAYGRELPYIPLNLVEIGRGGVRQFLERGNLWSGRGQYRTLEEQVKAVEAANEEARIKFREEQKFANRKEQREKRAWRFGIPVVPVLTNLKDTAARLLGRKKASATPATSGRPGRGPNREK